MHFSYAFLLQLQKRDRKGTGSSPHVSLLKKNSGSTLKTKMSYTGDPEALEQSGKLWFYASK